MAVVSPVLERKVNTREESENKTAAYRGAVMTEEEEHNSRIKSNYAKLINPETTLSDIIVREPEDVQPAETQTYVPVRETSAQRPYLVENARADADIFRADSIINRRPVNVGAPVAVAERDEEEENEDLRPTQTTIQYKTAGVKKSAEEGKISTSETTKKAGFSKRDKIVIAAVVCVIVALFVLIIVNSAIISSVNSDLHYLQSSLTSAKIAYSGVSDRLQEYLANIGETVGDFAERNGMVLK